MYTIHIWYCKNIYFSISQLTLYVFVTEMAEYTGKQQKEEEEDDDMDMQNIFAQELQEDEDINNFISELFNEHNTLPKCELCYHNRESLKCNGILYYKLSLKYYKSSPLLALWLQHIGKHTPLSLLTP